MKTLLTFAIAIALTLGVQAQSKRVSADDVPQVIKTSFAQTYPNANSITWKQINSDYIAEFTQTTTTSYVLYTQEGKLIETKEKITTFSMPSLAYDYIKNNYPNVPLKEYFRITDSSGLTTYSAKVKDEEIIFDKKGLYMKTVDFVL